MAKYGGAKNRVGAETVSSLVEYTDGIQTFRAYGVGGVKNKATTEAMRQYSRVCYLYEAKGIPIGFGFNILLYLTAPLIMLTASAPWMAGRLSGVDYLVLSMLPILLTKLISQLCLVLISNDVNSILTV